VRHDSFLFCASLISDLAHALRSRVNERGQTRLRCADGWTSATASTGTVLFEPLSTTRSPVPRRSALGSPLATVSEEDDGSGAEDVLLEEETAMDPMQEVDAAVQLATKIETWLADIPIGGKMPRRFDSAGLIQFGAKRLSLSCAVGWRFHLAGACGQALRASCTIPTQKASTRSMWRAWWRTLRMRALPSPS